MKRLFFLLSCGIALQLTAQNNFDQAEIRQLISPEETKEILFTLASDEMKGRDTVEANKAADFVAAILSETTSKLFILLTGILVTDSLVSYNMVA